LIWNSPDVKIRPALQADTWAMYGLVQRAYGHYVDRIGHRPAPMDDDYDARVRDDQAYVAEDEQGIAGLIVLVPHEDHLLIDNVAVEPERQGGGVGGELLAFAEREARERRLSELRLYTHVTMTENQTLYAHLGYRETERRGEHGFERVFFAKTLPATTTIRPATRADAEAVCDIYNHGIAGREATFETEPRRPDDVLRWFDSGLPFLVAADDAEVVGWARVTPYSPRAVYAGVGEHAVYVHPDVHGRGIGRDLLEALAEVAERSGMTKLTSRVLTTNAASLRAHRAAGFREVGVQRRHGRLDGRWQDCVLVERLLGPAAREDAV
jgi:L-amino acid N-acyltransferase YncA